MSVEHSQNEIKIRDALTSLLQEKDLSQIRVTEVVKKANVARSTFYLYYDSIYSVLQEIEDEYFIDLERTMPQPETKKDFNPFMLDSELFSKYSSFLSAMLGPYGSSAFRFKKEKFLRRYFDQNWPDEFKQSPYYPYLEAIILGGRIDLEYYMAKNYSPENVPLMTHIALLFHNHTVEIIKELI